MGKEPHGCVSLLNDGSGSRLMTKGVRSILACFLLASLLLSGCTSVIGPPEPKARLSVDVDSIHAGEAVNFDARESSTPDTTVTAPLIRALRDSPPTSMKNRARTKPASR